MRQIDRFDFPSLQVGFVFEDDDLVFIFVPRHVGIWERFLMSSASFVKQLNSVKLRRKSVSPHNGRINFFSFPFCIKKLNKVSSRSLPRAKEFYDKHEGCETYIELNLLTAENIIHHCCLLKEKFFHPTTQIR